MVATDVLESAGGPAGTVGDGIAFRVVDEREDVFVLKDLLFRIDLVHDGGDLHEAAALDVRKTKQGAQLPVKGIAEEFRDFRVLEGIRVRHDELIETGDERGNMIEVFPVFGQVLEEQALLTHVPQHRRGFFDGDARRLRDFLDGSGFVLDVKSEQGFLLRDEELEHFGKITVFADGT